jgi:hypothetical protein
MLQLDPPLALAVPAQVGLVGGGLSRERRRRHRRKRQAPGDRTPV